MLDLFAGIDAFNQRICKAKRENDPDIDRVEKELIEELHKVKGKLYRKYPFAIYKKHKPELGNPFAEVSARTDVWNEAHSYLGYTQSEEE